MKAQKGEKVVRESYTSPAEIPHKTVSRENSNHSGSVQAVQAFSKYNISGRTLKFYPKSP
jgi:hypothetical protein